MKPILRDVQMVFQDPYASLDPRMRVGDLVAEPLLIHGIARGQELEDRVAYLFGRVGLSRDLMKRYPHEFSGGQRQRICIARALSLSPKAIIADESVSALDVSIQAQVLDLLQDIQNETGIAYLFISHDMAVVEQISHRVAVMYMGRIVEMGQARRRSSRTRSTPIRGACWTRCRCPTRCGPSGNTCPSSANCRARSTTSTTCRRPSPTGRSPTGTWSPPSRSEAAALRDQMRGSGAPQGTTTG